MKRSAISFICFGFIAFSGYGQTTHFVDPAGNCGGNTPCYTTIHDAIAAASNGDTIEVDYGTYTYSGQLAINKEVVLRAKPGLPTEPVISINYASYTSCGLQIAANNVIVDGFEIIGVKTTGGRYLVGDYNSARNYWTIRNCRIHDSDQGVRIVGDNITIEDNEIYETLGDCIDCEYGTCGGLKVTRNRLHSENTNSGRKPAGITYNCDASTTGDVEISYNYCYSCRTFIDFQHNGDTAPLNSILVIHNTVDWNMGPLPPVPSGSDIAQQMSIAFWTGSGTWDASRFTIRDNIFSRQKWYMIVNTSGTAGPISGNMEILNNLFFDWYLVDAYFPAYQYPEEWPSARGAVGWSTTDDDFVFIDNVLSDPLYLSTGASPSEYYALTGSSPALNTASDGTNIGAWQSETYIWTGAVSTDWHTAGNWNLYFVPGETTHATIPAEPANQPVITSAADCNDLSIAEGASLTIHSDGSGNGTLITNGTITNNGTINVQRYFSGNDIDWHLVSSPISNGLSGVFLDMYLQSHDETTNTYTEIIPVDIPLNVMEGYGLYSNLNNDNTRVFTGGLNNGTLSREFTSGNLGWNLMGNPYPSSIDWEAVTIPAGMSNEVHYIEASTGNDLSYVQGTGGTGSQYIPPMQGFFVNATAGGTFTLDNSVRTHSGSGHFYKSSNPDLLVLEASGEQYSDQAWIHFNDEADIDHDGTYDAYKRISLSNPHLPQIYSITPGGDMLSVNGLPETESLLLGFTAVSSGKFTIATPKLMETGTAILEDLKTGLFTNLSENAYTFSYKTGEAPERFVLHFKMGSEPGHVNIYGSDGSVYVTTGNENEGSVFVCNLTGQAVNQAVLDGLLTRIDVPGTGYYLVKVIQGTEVTAAKVYVK
ncbi:MAG: hypothetical protein JW861_10215 [Bacteroidales bacterium]|nr:hypothetical protein [Bacteroidales bacterium]